MRDPGKPQQPGLLSDTPITSSAYFSGTHVHYGLIFGVVACLLAWFLLERTSLGLKVKIAGGNVRAAQLVGACRWGASS